MLLTTKLCPVRLVYTKQAKTIYLPKAPVIYISTLAVKATNHREISNSLLNSILKDELQETYHAGIRAKIT